ncbi:hypothetical protein ACFYO2_15360 [Streptomyces sp. NPDC006602]|uniref:hypothetical protein n=1 Tax=Streptomyces sp. NPDC006602 TaxID=3364751 RepID=UPI0036CD12A9
MRALAAVITCVGLAGCGSESNGAGGSAEPPLGTRLKITDTRELRLPLDSYRLSREEQWSLTVARVPLVERCMKQYGFDYHMVLPQRRFPMADNERIFGLTDEDSAHAYGYRLPPQKLEKLPPEPELTPQGQAVMEGSGQSTYKGVQVPKGGCDGESKRALMKGAPQVEDTDAAGVLALQVADRVEQDSRVRRAFADWSACMKKRGFNYQNPMDPNNDPNNNAHATASKREIETAVADVRCKRETNLISTWATVTVAYQKRAVEENAERLKVQKQALQTMLRNANQAQHA